MAKPNGNLIRWKLIQQIQACIQSVNGVIFGGAVRDKIIHDHYATEFYNIKDVDRKKYNDITYQPESALRVILPNDIDCFMKTSQIPLFIEKLKDKLLAADDHGTTEARIYFPEIDVADINALKHSKFRIKFAINPILKSEIKIDAYYVMLDIIHTENSIENIEPPFGSIDFECNSIILTSDDTYKLSNVLTKNFTPKKKIEKMNQIMTNILRKETTIVYADLPEFRITKLLKYGWTINSENVKIFKEITPHDKCMLCLDSFKNSQYQTKLQCCNNRLHTHCLKKLFSTTEYDNLCCPMCRKDTYIMTDDKKLSNIE